MKYPLIFPMAVYVFFVGGLLAYMFRTRVRAIKTQQMKMNFFKTYSGQELPENVIVAGRHYDNQFQLPMLFFITCGIHMITGMSNYATLFLAWAFVVSRFAHSWVHLGSNKVRHRVVVFGIGWLIVLLLWAQLVYFAL